MLLFKIIFYIVVISVLIRFIMPFIYAFNKKQKEKVLKNLSGFGRCEYIISIDGSSALALNVDDRKLCYIDKTNKSHIITQQEVLDSQIIVDGKSKSKHWGVKIGALMAGESEHLQEVKKVELKLRIDNLHLETPTLLFLKSTKYLPTTGILSNQYRQAMSKADYWNEKLLILSKTK